MPKPECDHEGCEATATVHVWDGTGRITNEYYLCDEHEPEHGSFDHHVRWNDAD